MADPGISEWGPNPSMVEFWGSGDCLDAPSHILYVFVVRVENKIHIKHIACRLITTIEIHACYAFNSCSKFRKTNPITFSNGACPRCAGPGSAFGTIVLTKSNQMMILFCLCTSCNSLSLLKVLDSPLCSVQLLASVFVLSILGQVRASVIIPTILRHIPWTCGSKSKASCHEPLACCSYVP